MLYACDLGSSDTASEPRFPVLEAHWTRTLAGSTHDAVSDAVFWAGHDLLSGRRKDTLRCCKKVECGRSCRVDTVYVARKFTEKRRLKIGKGKLSKRKRKI